MHAAVITQARFLDSLGAFLKPVPGIFFVLANVFLENNAQEKFHRFETGFVHVWQRRQHGADFHVQSPEALVPVTHRGIDEANFVAHNPPVNCVRY